MHAHMVLPVHCSRCRTEQVGFFASSVPRIVVDLLFSGGLFGCAATRCTCFVQYSHTGNVRPATGRQASHRLAANVNASEEGARAHSRLSPYILIGCMRHGHAHWPVIGTMHL